MNSRVTKLRNGACTGTCDSACTSTCTCDSGKSGVCSRPGNTLLLFVSLVAAVLFNQIPSFIISSFNFKLLQALLQFRLPRIQSRLPPPHNPQEDRIDEPLQVKSGHWEGDEEGEGEGRRGAGIEAALKENEEGVPAVEDGRKEDQVDLTTAIERPQTLQTGLLRFYFSLEVRQQLFIILNKEKEDWLGSRLLKRNFYFGRFRVKNSHS